ncbi:MAG: hypothetical protein IKV16_01045 [Clostridia bacterium]|nr:hypothetical protein [Clostridia bacterium]
MFKYLRNINGTLPSQIFTFYSQSQEEPFGATYAGTIFGVVNGVIGNQTEPSNPLYLACNTVEAEESGDVRGILLTEGSVLLADLDPTAEKYLIHIGTLCGLGVDDTAKGINVTLDGPYIFEIVDASDAKNGKVSVRVI